jgi:serine/threonine protein kinase
MAKSLLEAGGYLQVHNGTYPEPIWAVAPCYSGTLKELAPLFLAAPHQVHPSSIRSLVGARYLFHELLGQLASLHDEMHIIHQDIKSSSIFLSQPQRRFILGDRMIASKMTIANKGLCCGLTFMYASPEQIAERQWLTPASDVFSLCVTMVNNMLQSDPAVSHNWAEVHPSHPKPSMLFPPHEVEPAHAAWKLFCGDKKALQGVQEDYDFTYLGGKQHASIRSCLEHFDRVAEVFSALDTPLWEALCSGLKVEPTERPTAKALQQRLPLSASDRDTCAATWLTVPPYRPSDLEELEHLKPLVDALVQTD